MRKRIGDWIWPFMACIVGWYEIAKRFNYPIANDAQYVYLPAAKAFLEQGWSYLLTPESYRVVPLAYLWPSLWGAEPSWIRIANGGLWAGCVYFLWQLGCLLGGYRAGVMAVVLLAAHPELLHHFPTEMTEPIFLFGLLGWMYVMAQMLIGGRSAGSMVSLGAFMLSLTLLSRPVLQLLAPALLGLCLAFLLYWRFVREEAAAPQHQRVLVAISLSLALGLALPLALVIKNGVVFGLWGLGTGSGTGLYLGTHPLFQGAEPSFLGFDYDVTTLAALTTGSGDHLSLAADRITRNAALWQIQAMSLPEALSFYSRKLWWWLAHHPAHFAEAGGSLRKWRFFELLLLSASIVWLALGWLRPRSDARPLKNATTPMQLAFGGFLLAMFLAMLIQLLPILYNSRYSAALLDPWLIPLAAFGFAWLTAPIQLHIAFGKESWSIEMAARNGVRIWPVIAVLILILALSFGGYSLMRKYERVAIDTEHMGQTFAHLKISASNRVITHGMAPHGERSWSITESPAAFEVGLNAKDIEQIKSAQLNNALWKTDVALRGGKPCKAADISYRTADGRILQPRYRLPLLLPLHSDGTLHALVTHANYELRPRETGSLRVVLHCPVGTRVEWYGTQLLESRHVREAATHAQPQLPSSTNPN